MASSSAIRSLNDDRSVGCTGTMASEFSSSSATFVCFWDDHFLLSKSFEAILRERERERERDLMGGDRVRPFIGGGFFQEVHGVEN